MPYHRHKSLLLLAMSFTFAACQYSTPSPMSAPVASPRPTPAAADISSVATQINHETFALTGEQVQEIAVFMDFMRAYKNGRLEAALALLSQDVAVSDCDYRAVTVILFRGKSQAPSGCATALPSMTV